MATEWKEPMAWDNAGTAPSDNLKANGFKAGDKPPASVFNYFLNKTAESINQLQDEVDSTNTALDAHKTDTTTKLGNKVDKVSGKGLSTNDYTTTEKNKLAGIATGANAYTHPTTSGNKHIPSGGSSGQILRWSADGTAAWGSDNNTTYSEATQSAQGLMSAADKKKLDGIAEGANAYSLPTASSTLGGVKTTSTVTSTSGLTACPIISGVPYYKDTNSSYTHPTTSGNKHIPSGGSSGQILRWSADGTAAWGADNNTTYGEANQSTAGLMSAADKKKLDGIATSANNYSHPTSSGNKHIPSGGSSGQILRWSADGTAVWGADNNTTYSEATTSAAGLMSASDKSKLNGIASGANAYSLPAAGSSLGGVKTGGDVSISNGVISVNDDSHGHTSITPVTTGGTGAAYTATVAGITALTAGVSFIMVTHTVSTTKTPTLNVNSLGAKGIRRRLSNSVSSVQSGYANGWLVSGKPFHVMYDGSYWIVEDLPKIAVADLYGTLPIAQGGTGATTAEAALENLGITSLLSSSSKVSYGSYMGKYTELESGYANTLTFDFEPKALIVYAPTYQGDSSTKSSLEFAIFIKGATQGFYFENYYEVNNAYNIGVSWGDSSVSFGDLTPSNTDEFATRNLDFYCTYYYVAIG